MKKILALTLMAVMAVTLLAGCGNALYDDFENFLNVEMAEVNEDYVKLTTEVASWGDLEDEELVTSSISDKLLPLIEGSLTKLETVNPETEEVKELKAKYIKVMEAYKAGFESIYEGFMTQDEAILIEGNEKLTEGVSLLDEYNAALEALAKEVGAEIQY